MRRNLAIFIAAIASGSAAFADVVVIGNVAAPSVTKEQVAEVYLGRSQIYTPIDLPETSQIRVEFYRSATGRDLVQVKSLWARLIFTGKAQPPKEVPDAAAVKKSVAADPKAIGYIDKAAVDSSVKVLLTLN